MVRSLNTGAMLRLVLVATAAVSVAACQSKPKPKYNTTPQTTTAPDTRLPPSRTDQAPVTSQPLGATPGSVQDFVVSAGERVYFELNSYEVSADGRPILDAQASWLRRYPAVKVRIEGNCDERGTREYNLALGARRANAVRDYLVSHGVSADRITTISYGKEMPLDPGTTDDAYAKNRNARTGITEGAR